MPFGGFVLLPVIFLNTHLHELAHALTAIVTGGQAHEIVVRGDGSGVTLTSGGLAIPIASAGYLGTTALGLLAILLARSPGAARGVLRGLGILLAIGMVLLVRGDLVGVLTGALWTLALLALGGRLRGRAAVFVAQLVALALLLASFGALGDLFTITVSTDRGTDAANLQRLTGIPALLWTVLWAGLSAWATVAALRILRRPPVAS